MEKLYHEFSKKYFTGLVDRRPGVEFPGRGFLLLECGGCPEGLKSTYMSMKNPTRYFLAYGGRCRGCFNVQSARLYPTMSVTCRIISIICNQNPRLNRAIILQYQLTIVKMAWLSRFIGMITPYL